MKPWTLVIICICVYLKMSNKLKKDNMIFASVHRHMFNLHIIDHWFLSGEKVAEFWGLFYIKLYQLCVIAVHLITRNTTICVLLNCSQNHSSAKLPWQPTSLWYVHSHICIPYTHICVFLYICVWRAAPCYHDSGLGGYDKILYVWIFKTISLSAKMCCCWK